MSGHVRPRLTTTQASIIVDALRSYKDMMGSREMQEIIDLLEGEPVRPALSAYVSEPAVKVYVLLDWEDTHDAQVSNSVIKSIHSTPEGAMAVVAAEHPDTILNWDHHPEQWDCVFDGTETCSVCRMHAVRYEYSVVVYEVVIP